MKVGLQTTFDRPIINTRDESHSTDEYRRLHVIVGDANRMDVPQALKLGTTSMLLWLLEHAEEAGLNMDEALRPTTLADPVRAMHEVSHDLTLGDARIAAVDLKWAAIDPADSIFDRLRAQTERLVMDEQLEQASVEAPSTTRAWLRAEIIRRFPEQVVAASWSRLTVRHRTISDNTVENPMVSLDMSDPLKYGKSQCSGYCERVQDAASILEMLR